MPRTMWPMKVPLSVYIKAHRSFHLLIRFKHGGYDLLRLNYNYCSTAALHLPIAQTMRRTRGAVTSITYQSVYRRWQCFLASLATSAGDMHIMQRYPATFYKVQCLQKEIKCAYASALALHVLINS